MNLFVCRNASQVSKSLTLAKKCDVITIFTDDYDNESLNFIKNLALLNGYNITPISGFLSAVFTSKYLSPIIINYLFSVKFLKFGSRYLYNRLLSDSKVEPSKLDEIYMFHDAYPVSKVVLRNKMINLLEDGLVNYSLPEYSGFHKLMSGLFNLELSYIGLSHRVNKIFLTGLKSTENLPKILQDKIEIINFDYSKLNFDSEIEYNCVILTQPLDTSGYCSNDKKEKLYLYIFDCLSKFGLNPVLKIHPRDLSDYKNIPQIRDSRLIPFELLKMEDTTTLVSLFSSGEVSNVRHFRLIENNYKKEVEDLNEGKIIELIDEVFDKIKVVYD
ncbi:hypothetical protein VCHA34P129_100030 [Vibrio chagasii]|nr:hypothetical protein VCHA34P129_100030 [Vibrio chagasii]CAH6907424.1 hypothetical protein VCHA52P455_100045 [Vibrio chagasii]